MQLHMTIYDYREISDMHAVLREMDRHRLTNNYLSRQPICRENHDGA